MISSLVKILAGFTFDDSDCSASNRRPSKCAEIKAFQSMAKYPLAFGKISSGNIKKIWRLR